MTIRTKPIDFVIGGAQKCGTTSLYGYLGLHPDIFMPTLKELHFFNTEKTYRRGLKADYLPYHQHFQEAAEGQLCGEATPAYMFNQFSPRRIWKYDPGMKWIIILRDPIKRAYSEWNKNRQRNNDPLPFGEAIRIERERNQAAPGGMNPYKSYVTRGYYCEQIRRVWALFPREQTHFIKNEDLRDHPVATMGGVCDFLELPHLGKFDLLSAHAGKYTTTIQSEDHAYLSHLYEFEIKQLERILDWDCSNWLRA